MAAPSGVLTNNLAIVGHIIRIVVTLLYIFINIAQIEVDVHLMMGWNSGNS